MEQEVGASNSLIIRNGGDQSQDDHQFKLNQEFDYMLSN